MKKRKLKNWVKVVLIALISMILIIISFFMGYLYGKNYREKNFYPHGNILQIKYTVPNPVVKFDNQIEVEKASIQVSKIEETADDLIYLGEFKLTGYCDCYECQEEWVGTTALGVAPTTEWTIAVDPDVIPLGSIVVIDGFDNIFRAEDVGSMINSNHIDIFCSSHSECFNEIYNRRDVKVYIITDGLD